MSAPLAQQLSDDLAGAASKTSASLVLIRGRRGRAASGTAIDAQRFVVSDHLLDAEDTIRVRTASGEATARLVGRDSGTDLALLQIEGATLTPVTMASEAVRVGEMVLAVGRTWTGLVAHPGFVTHLSGPHQVSPGFRLEQAIHTSLDPFSGFSGGALVSARGDVVGISTSALDRGRGLAIPARDVTRIVDSLREHGRLRRGYLGISSLSVALPERQRQGGAERGLLVTSVAPESPADHAQILVGDVVLAIDSTSAARPDDLAAYLTADRVGRNSTLHILRGGNAAQLEVTIGERVAARH
ncbi:MAG TPA: trypsin-like peptidase domain-containing protein [Vicinamibacterales bacterium]|nr:trypsin-like peptidase domain-containing protein [Vicinamibacterales bacterium]